MKNSVRNNNRFSIYILVCSISFMLSCNSFHANNFKLQNSVEASNKKFTEYFNKGNTVNLASMYTTNGQLLPTHSAKITGRDQIKIFWQKYIDEGTKIKLKTLEVEGVGNNAYEIGEYLLYEGEFKPKGDFTVKAWCKYIVIWRTEKGQLKQHRCIWNENQTLSKRSD
jgi:ketosteroid isomerase-like protein